MRAHSGASQHSDGTVGTAERTHTQPHQHTHAQTITQTHKMTHSQGDKLHTRTHRHAQTSATHQCHYRVTQKPHSPATAAHSHHTARERRQRGTATPHRAARRFVRSCRRELPDHRRHRGTNGGPVAAHITPRSHSHAAAGTGHSGSHRAVAIESCRRQRAADLTRRHWAVRLGACDESATPHAHSHARHNGVRTPDDLGQESEPAALTHTVHTHTRGVDGSQGQHGSK